MNFGFQFCKVECLEVSQRLSIILKVIVRSVSNHEEIDQFWTVSILVPTRVVCLLPREGVDWKLGKTQRSTPLAWPWEHRTQSAAIRGQGCV